MAGHADGIYYYVPTAEQLRSALGDCLAGLISTVAYNIFIQIEGDVKVKYPILPFQRIYNTNKLHIGNIQSQEVRKMYISSLNCLTHSKKKNELWFSLTDQRYYCQSDCPKDKTKRKPNSSHFKLSEYSGKQV